MFYATFISYRTYDYGLVISWKYKDYPCRFPVVGVNFYNLTKGVYHIKAYITDAV